MSALSKNGIRQTSHETDNRPKPKKIVFASFLSAYNINSSLSRSFISFSSILRWPLFALISPVMYLDLIRRTDRKNVIVMSAHQIKKADRGSNKKYTSADSVTISHAEK